MKTTNIKKVTATVTAAIMSAATLMGCGFGFKATTAPMPSENVYYADTEPEGYYEAPAACDEGLAYCAPADEYATSDEKISRGSGWTGTENIRLAGSR